MEERIAMIWFGIKLEKEKPHWNPEIQKLRILLKETKNLEKDLNVSSNLMLK